MQPNFSIGESLSLGWKTARANSGLLLKVVLTIAVLQLASGLFKVEQVSTSGDVISVLISLILGVLGTVCGVGLVVIALKLVRGENATYENILPSWHIFWRFALVSVITSIFVLVGFVLLIIPGIYLLLRFSMAKIVIIDKKETRVFDAIRISGEMTKGVKWELLGLFLVLVLINILGLLLFIVGLLVTIPVSVLALAHVYAILSKKHSPAAVAHA